MTTTLKAFKGFDQNLKCRDFQYEIGKTYEHDGGIQLCASGFHACENPLDVFGYYNPGQSRFAEVELSGTVAKDGDKVCASSITIKAEISLSVFLQTASSMMIDCVMSGLKKDKKKTAHRTEDKSHATNTGYQSAATNTGDQSAATNTGYQSAATNTGDQSAASNTGNYSAATNTGDRSAASNTGNYSAATNTGDQSAATNTGYRSAATNTGDQSAASNTGYRSAATNTGDQSAATNTGDRSAATNTGDQSAATNTGDRSAATNTGDQSAAEVTGQHSVAAVFGYESKARASKGSWIVVAYRNDKGELLHLKTAQAGVTRGVKADTWYTLNADGKFFEVE